MGRVLKIFIENIGSIASVIGMLASVYVLINLRIIKKKFLFKARIPDLIKSLKAHTKIISHNLHAFSRATRELETELSRCMATLNNLKNKVDRNIKQSTNQLVRKIQKRKKPLEKDEMWEIYNELQELIDLLDHLQKDIKWG